MTGRVREVQDRDTCAGNVIAAVENRRTECLKNSSQAP